MSIGERPDPTVSVIVPTFNRAHLLRLVLETIRDQNYPSHLYEVIVVDNNSTDETEAVVARFAETAAVDVTFVQERRPGLVFTRHSGAAHARGEILMFADDDALYEPNWITAVVDVYHSHPHVGAVGTSINVKWDEQPEDWVRAYEGYLGAIEYPPTPRVQLGLCMNGGSCSVRKRLLYAVKGFNPGQKGDYIVGDSEVGLCRKLEALGVPVGGTSATVAWHMQFKERHATFDDVKRRVRNNGICQAYADTFYGRSMRSVAWEAACRAVIIAKGMAKCVVKALLGYELKTSVTAVRLQLSEFCYRIKYLVLYRCDSAIRAEIARTEWELTADYKAPLAVVFRRGIMQPRPSTTEGVMAAILPGPVTATSLVTCDATTP